MQFKDYFKNRFTDKNDCVIGCEFKSISQKIPRRVNTGVKLESNARCAISKEANQATTVNKIKELKSRTLNPCTKQGEFLKAREIHVYNSSISGSDRKPDPLSILKKRRKIDRVHLANLCSIKNYSIGFIVLLAGISQNVSLEHVAKIEEVSKLE